MPVGRRHDRVGVILAAVSEPNPDRAAAGRVAGTTRRLDQDLRHPAAVMYLASELQVALLDRACELQRAALRHAEIAMLEAGQEEEKRTHRRIRGKDAWQGPAQERILERAGELGD